MAAPADAERTAAVRGGGSPPSTWPEVLALTFLLASGFQLEPQSTELLAQEERFSEILKEYELKCRVSVPLPCPRERQALSAQDWVAPPTSWPPRRGWPSLGPQEHPYMSRAGIASDVGFLLQLRSSEPRVFVFQKFLAVLHGLWDRSFLTRDGTHTLGSESHGVLNAGLPGNFPSLMFYKEAVGTLPTQHLCPAPHRLLTPVPRPPCVSGHHVGLHLVSCG